MPIRVHHKGGRYYFQFGATGAKYSFNPKSKDSMRKAYKRVLSQARAIEWRKHGGARSSRRGTYRRLDVQSVLFPKSWTAEKSVRWLAAHHYKHRTMRTTARHRRFRQHPTKRGYKYRTLKLDNKVELVLMYRE